MASILVTMITPVFAIALGASLNGEALTVNLLVGGCLVLIGLGLYQFGYKIALLTRKNVVKA